jgi:hypothetical protein
LKKWGSRIPDYCEVGKCGPIGVCLQSLSSQRKLAVDMSNYLYGRRVTPLNEGCSTVGVDMPKIGTIVIYKRNGDDCAAIITKIHDENLVNLSIFPDGEAMEIRTQVAHGDGVGMWEYPV